MVENVILQDMGNIVISQNPNLKKQGTLASGRQGWEGYNISTCSSYYRTNVRITTLHVYIYISLVFDYNAQSSLQGPLIGNKHILYFTS